MPLKIEPGTLKKLQPKLRMIADGDTRVNVIRAERCAGLAVDRPRVARQVPIMRGERAVPVTLEDFRRQPKAPPLKRVTRALIANVFVYLRDAGVATPTIDGPSSRQGRIVQAQVPLGSLAKIAAHKDVAYVEMAEALKLPAPVVARRKPDRPTLTERRVAGAAHHHDGEGVLIGIIDVQGFDFAHPDFLDERGRTRFVRVWDQGGTGRPHPSRAQFEYGAEITDKHMNAALRARKRVGLPATELEPQSQQVEGSHGTHVASIAAGNRGVCRRSQIAAVLISLPESDLDKRLSFYDSSRLVDAVDYLLELAARLKRPISINISLGTNGHAHDGSAAVTRWIDAQLAVGGRCVTVAAGNSGQERGETADDFGWMMGRIHSSGQIAAAGLEHHLEWLVIGNTRMDVSENEMEIWFSAQDRIAVSVKPPGGGWIGPVEPRQYIQNRMLADGSMMSVYNEVLHPANGLNHISVFLSPFFGPEAIIGVNAGTWTVRLHAREIRDGRFHAWIERDDPHKLGRIGDREAWRFPSFFAESSLVDDSTVSSLGCANRVVSVANLDSTRNRISRSSSEGPTRDGRLKPDVAAPGTDIVAANGFGDPAQPWISLSGTSMASPFVAGVAGLMLAVAPELTSAQIEGILRRTARPLPGASFAWAKDAGFGRLDPDACLAEVRHINERKDLG